MQFKPLLREPDQACGYCRLLLEWLPWIYWDFCRGERHSTHVILINERPRLLFRFSLDARGQIFHGLWYFHGSLVVDENFIISTRDNDSRCTSSVAVSAGCFFFVLHEVIPGWEREYSRRVKETSLFNSQSTPLSSTSPPHSSSTYLKKAQIVRQWQTRAFRLSRIVTRISPWIFFPLIDWKITAASQLLPSMTVEWFRS